MGKRAGNTALYTTFGITKDASCSTAEEVRYNARKNKSERNEACVNETKQDQTKNSSNKGRQKPENNGIWCIGKRNGAIERRLCTRDELLGNALKCGDNLTNDETNTRKNDIHTTGKRETAQKCPDYPVCGGLSTDVKQIAKMLKTCICRI